MSAPALRSLPRTLSSITPSTRQLIHPPNSRPLSASASASMAAASKREWMVHVPDFPDSLQKRLEARPVHLQNLKPSLEDGTILMGGAILSEQPTEGHPPPATGSALLLTADSQDAVRKWLENDHYAKSGVWDVKNAQIWPFKCAVRNAM